MRKIDPSLPPTHRHMHNNLLNVTVETGWIGLACYIWWIVTTVIASLKTWRYFSSSTLDYSCNIATFSLCSAISIIGWQIAGLVEYNFGDGEVFFIIFAFMGVTLALTNIARKAQNCEREGHFTSSRSASDKKR